MINLNKRNNLKETFNRKFEAETLFKRFSAIMFFALMLSTLLALQTNFASADSVSLAEKIKKAEENVVWLDKKYSEYFNFEDTIVGVLIDKNSKYYETCFMDKNFKKIVSYNVDKEQPWDVVPNLLDTPEGIAPIMINGKYGYVNKKGKLIVKPKYDSASKFSEGIAIVELNKRDGMIDTSGREIVKTKYYAIHQFKEGVASFSLTGRKWGFMDKTGKEVIKAKYDYANDFSEGMAKVEIGGKWGYIDKSGREVVKPKYNDVKNFKNGMAIVKMIKINTILLL